MKLFKFNIEGKPKELKAIHIGKFIQDFRVKFPKFSYLSLSGLKIKITTL